MHIDVNDGFDHMFLQRLQSKTQLPSVKVSPKRSRENSLEKVSCKNVLIGNKKYNLKLPSVNKLKLIV